jgi:hypothetical protein
VDRRGRIEVDPDRLEQRLGLEGLAPAFEPLDVGVVGDVERPLGDDRPLIEVGRYVVGTDAGDPDSLLDGLS